MIYIYIYTYIYIYIYIYIYDICNIYIYMYVCVCKLFHQLVYMRDSSCQRFCFTFINYLFVLISAVFHVAE